MPTLDDYLDRYTPEKGWKKVLFKPGRIIQSSELNEVQSIVADSAKEFGGSIYGEGAIIQGCEMFYNESTKVFTVGEGKFFALGYVHDVPELQVTLAGVGLEEISLKLLPVIITENDDSDLLDQATSTDAYGKPGAHRLNYDYQLVINDNTGSLIAIVTENKLSKTYNQVNPLLDPVHDILAQRTFEESGHYTVQNFKYKVENLPEDDPEYRTHLLLTAKRGIAYVAGYRVQNSVTVFRIDRPFDTSSRVDEPEPYVDSVNVYDMDSTPVLSVDAVTAIIRSPEITLNRGGVGGGQDEIPVQYQPVSVIYTVHDFTGPGATRKDYVNGVDFVMNGNYVDWSPGGAEPSTGSTYYLVVDWVKQMVKGTRIATEIVDENVTRAGGDDDTVANDFVKSIIQVKQTSTTYYEGTDFTVDGGPGIIHWLGANRPAAGSYQVTYTYWAIDVEGDYLGRDSFRDGSGTPLSDETPDYLYNEVGSVNYGNQITFDTTGEKPIPGGLVFYDYQYTLPRFDRIIANTDGRLEWVRGKAATSPKWPSIVWRKELHLFGVSLDAEARATWTRYGSNNRGYRIWRSNHLRTTMHGIRQIVYQVRQIVRNQAIFALDQAASDTASDSEKVGILTDRFADFDRSDTGHSEYSVTLDTLTQELNLPQTEEAHSVSLTTGSFSTSSDPYDASKALVAHRQIIRPYTMTLVAIQPFATGTIQVNPYTVVNVDAILELDPAIDRWTDTVTTTVRGSTRTVVLPPTMIRNRVFIRTINGIRQANRIDTSTMLATVTDESLLGTRQRRWIRRWNRWVLARRGVRTTTTVSSSTSTSISSTTNIQTQVSESLEVEELPFARVIPIQCSGSGFIPNEDNIEIFFDGVKVAATATGITVAGTKAGSVKAQGDGSWTAEISVPPETESGPHDVEAVSDDQSTAGTIAAAEFLSEGSLESTIRDISFIRIVRPIIRRTTRVTVNTNVRRLRRTDPIAETFQFEDSFYLAKVDIYFNSNDTQNRPVDLLIVDAENGTPTVNILAEKRLMPADVNDSLDALSETSFVFDRPCYLEGGREYAFIIRSDSDEYTIHISKLGDTDPLNGLVAKQPFTGVMLSSANMSTWTAHQTEDVKFALYSADFSGGDSEITVAFDAINFASPRSRFELSSVEYEPNKECQVRWEYTTDSTNWFEFVPPVEVDLEQAVNSIEFRAILTGDANLTPVVMDEVAVHAYRWDASGVYMARQMILPQYTGRYAELYMTVSKESGTSIVPQLQTTEDTSGPWVNADWTALSRDLDEEWKEMRWYWDMTAGKKWFRLRMNLSTSDQNITMSCRNLKFFTRLV